MPSSSIFLATRGDDLVLGSTMTSSVIGLTIVVAGDAADDLLGERHVDLLALVDGPLGTPRGAAVDLAHDDVLGDVAELAGQVARVGGLERGVGQALAGAVGRREVLEDVQALAEVRADGRLDDLAEGLAIRPRMPASCCIWLMLPRAPESLMR
jgi:hypothetical protein